MHGNLFTHGADTLRVSRHDGEKAHEGLGIVTRMSSSIGQVKTLTAKQVEGGPEILNVPKNFGCYCSGYKKWQTTGRIQHLCQHHNNSLSLDSDAREY